MIYGLFQLDKRAGLECKNVIYVFLKLDQKSGFKFDVEKVGKDLAQIKT